MARSQKRAPMTTMSKWKLQCWRLKMVIRVHTRSCSVWNCRRIWGWMHGGCLRRVCCAGKCYIIVISRPNIMLSTTFFQIRLTTFALRPLHLGALPWWVMVIHSAIWALKPIVKISPILKCSIALKFLPCRIKHISGYPVQAGYWSEGPPNP
jgi:hypothetical protein